MGGGWLAERRWWGWLLAGCGRRYQGGCNRGVSDSMHRLPVPIFLQPNTGTVPIDKNRVPYLPMILSKKWWTHTESAWVVLFFSSKFFSSIYGHRTQDPAPALDPNPDRYRNRYSVKCRIGFGFSEFVS